MQTTLSSSSLGSTWTQPSPSKVLSELAREHCCQIRPVAGKGLIGWGSSLDHRRLPQGYG
jgi:hypothetical protein